MLATFAGGCFWCTEAVYQKIKGIIKVTPGYTGGNVRNPSYREVCSGRTGHAEAVQIEYDESIISYKELLKVFFETHDPTTLNRQSYDVGTEYRSAIFYHNQEQENLAKEFVNKLENEKVFKNKIVTEITKYDEFFEAEDYHKNYYENNKGSMYCRIIIEPKLKKVRKLLTQQL